MSKPTTYVYIYRCRLCRDAFEVRLWVTMSPLRLLYKREERCFATHEPSRACPGVGDLVGGYYDKD